MTGSTDVSILTAYESGGITAVMELAGYDDKTILQMYMDGINTVPSRLRSIIRTWDWDNFRYSTEKWYKLGFEIIQMYPHLMHDSNEKFKEIYKFLKSNPMIAIEPIRYSSGSSRSTTNKANKLTSQEASRFVEKLEEMLK